MSEQIICVTCTDDHANQTSAIRHVNEMSSMQKHFLIVFILAAVNAVLGAVYIVITHQGKRKPFHRNVVLSMTRRSAVIEKSAHNRQRKRRMSTHIAVSMKPRK